MPEPPVSGLVPPARIAVLRERDVAAAAMIERRAALQPWSETQLIDSLRNGHLALQLRADQQMVAFAICSWVLDEGSLLNIAVDPACQRRGYARTLLRELRRRLQAEGVSCCFLEVRESNGNAIALYRSEGFIQVGLRKNYYPSAQGRENALLMRQDYSEPMA